jgi:hypothetical protein
VTITGPNVGNTSLIVRNANNVNSGEMLLGGTTFGTKITRDSLGADQDLIFCNSHGGVQGYKFRTGTTTAGTTDLLTITGAGNVGIGTLAPNALLHLIVSDTSVKPAISLRNVGSGLFVFDIDVELNVTGGIDLFSVTSGVRTSRVSVLRDNGNVGIGTASPAQKLDVAGSVIFGQHDGTNFVNIERYSPSVPYGIIRAGSIDRDVAVGLSFQTRISNGSAIDAMTLDANGNLGIGTTSPDAKLDVNGSIQLRDPLSAGPFGVLSITNATFDGGTNIISAFNSTNLELKAAGSANIIKFTIGSTERARITAGGYLKASNTGTYNNATGAYHEFRGSTNAAGIVITNTSATYTDDLVYSNVAVAAGTGFNLMRLDSNSVAQFRVRGDGTIFAQNTTVQSISDARLKENIADATEGLDVITALRPVRYDWKPGYGNDRVNQLGFIAQEVEVVFPEAVSVWEMVEPTGDTDEDGKPITEKVDYKTVGPGALIPVLVKAIQEQQARIESLETSNAELMARIDTLES